MQAFDLHLPNQLGVPVRKRFYIRRVGGFPDKICNIDSEEVRPRKEPIHCLEPNMIRIHVPALAPVQRLHRCFGGNENTLRLRTDERVFSIRLVPDWRNGDALLGEHVESAQLRFCLLTKAVADATSLPIMLYNIPGRCGVDIVPETVARLAKECRNIVSIKEASGSVERVGELRRNLPDAFTILSGDDSLTLPFMAVGAVGVVSVASNLFPSEVSAVVRTCESGDLKSAEKLHRKLLPLFKDLFIKPNPVPVKTALAWRGAMAAEVRLPLCEMSEANQARLRKTLADFESSQ